MQIVINVPEKLVCEGFERHFTEEEKNILIRSIGNGTPLPKGHGRLIDADALLKKHPEFDTYPFPSTTIDNAPPIIKADKEYEADGGMQNDT